MPMSSRPPEIAIISLAIRDFRGIDHLDLDFVGPDGKPNRLAVLAGPNGCGKTAVLEAALITAGGYRLATGRRGRKAIRRGAEDYQIRADFQFNSMLFSPTIAIEDSSQVGPPKPSPPIPHWYFSSWRVPIFVGPVDVTAGRPGRRPAKTDVNRLLNVKQQLVNGAAIERFRPGQHSKVANYSKWMSSINQAWHEFYPGSPSEFFVDLADTDSKAVGGFDLFLGSPDGPRLEVDCLSAGQIELFLFLSALALNDDREGIVFIDEPELHLDPQWHRPILRSLMSLQPRAQFIVATHSPEIYDAARSYERHFLVPDNDPRARLWHEVQRVQAKN